jgi:HSP20 family protein
MSRWAYDKITPVRFGSTTVEEFVMANIEKKLPESSTEKSSHGLSRVDFRRPLENLRRQVDRLFEDFHLRSLHLPFARNSFDVEPFWRRELLGSGLPAVDITEKQQTFELTVELPGMDEKNIELKLSNGNLIIRGEKQEEIEEKKKDYYLSERHYGSFERIFNLPKGIDPENIDARFSKGLLTISLPKKPEEIKPEKTVQIKAS